MALRPEPPMPRMWMCCVDIGSRSYCRIFGSRNVWALCLMYMATNFNWYFLMYYLPGTLKKQFPDWGTTGDVRPVTPGSGR